MAARRRLGLREVRAIGPGEIVYDSNVPGFAARRQRDQITYVLRYRTQSGRQRWLTIGRHGAPWTPDEAREEAKRLLGDVARGNDPAASKHENRNALTVAELCDAYWTEVTAGRLLTRRGIPKKPSTLDTDRSRIECHIKPLLGRIPVRDLSRRDIEEFMHAVAEGKTASRTKTAKKRGLSIVRGGQGAATRTVSLLGALLTFAIRGLRADNPAHLVQTFAENRRERRLGDAEFSDLGIAIRQGKICGIWPPSFSWR